MLISSKAIEEIIMVKDEDESHLQMPEINENLPLRLWRETKLV